MAKTKLTPEQEKLDTDLWIILITMGVAFGLFLILQKPMYGIIKNSEVPVLARVLLAAATQFGLAGLGITIVSVFRRESFFSYGLKAKGAVLSIVLCVLCFVPYIVFSFVTGQITGYMPFQSVWTTKDVLASGFPVNVIGMLLTATAWGFFEGFNYVVISEKINKRYPTKNKWLDWGAIVSVVICILVHGAIGVSLEGIIGMLTIAIVVYGMLMVKKFTGNAWGCVFIFVFLWNAF